MSGRENNSSPMETADAMSASAHHIPGVVAAAFNGLGKEVPMAPKPELGVFSPNDTTAPQDVTAIPAAAEEQTVSPVASAGQVYFTFMVDCAVCEGYISREGADAALNALYPKVRS